MTDPADWRANWIANNFAVARVHIANGRTSTGADRDAERILLRVLQYCEDGCSLSELLQTVRQRLDDIGYRPGVYNAWLDQRSDAAWARYRNGERVKEARW